MFRAVHDADAHLQIKRHKFIPARQLLTVLQKTVPRLAAGEGIEISNEDYTIFRLLGGKVSESTLR